MAIHTRSPWVPTSWIGDDVGVGQLRQRLGLAQQLGSPGAGSLPAPSCQELEGDLAVELRVVGCVHHADAARADLAEDDVATDRRAAGELVREGGRPGHRGTCGGLCRFELHGA
jgi:hypothetical protein